jgi:serine/threonine-protein kinase
MHGEHDDRIAVREGDVLADKYRVERVLGSGGMGVVVAARHLRLEERVAIKFLHPDALTNAEAVARFEREARAAAKIKSEHVARVSDVGTLDNGCPYMIMEYLEGEDLAQWLQQRGPLAIDQAVEFILQTCEAMAEAHGLGIVHRDLKPANLFCIRRPDDLLSIKVLDFGISKVSVGAGLDMTRADAVMGSPLYMSPEQMLSARSVDARTDIWSMGVILYELISGRGPFRGENLPEVCMSIASHPTPSLRATRPDMPANLDAVIAKCLQKDRKRRYSNVAELAVALAPFAPKRARASVDRISRVIRSAGLADSVASPPSSDPSAEPPSPATIASWGQTAARGRRHRAGLLGVTAALGLGVGAVAATWVLQKSAPEAMPAVLDAATQPWVPAAAGLPSASAPTPEALASGAPPSVSGSVAVPPLDQATPSRPEPTRAVRPVQPRAAPAALAPRAPGSAPATVPRVVPPAPAATKSNELGGRL